MPPAWVDFCRVLVREKRDNVKQISVIVPNHHSLEFRSQKSSSLVRMVRCQKKGHAGSRQGGQQQSAPADEGIPMEEVVDILEETHPKCFDKSTSKMADWMMQQGHVPQGGKRATSQATLFCTQKSL
jgi:hypothetical protein